MSGPVTAFEKAMPRSLPQPLTGICGALAAVGIGAFFYGLSADPQSTWLAFHANFIYFGALSQAALVLCFAFVLVSARWPGPEPRPF